MEVNEHTMRKQVNSKIILTTRTVILTTEYGKEVSDTTAGL